MPCAAIPCASDIPARYSHTTSGLCISGPVSRRPRTSNSPLPSTALWGNLFPTLMSYQPYIRSPSAFLTAKIYERHTFTLSGSQGYAHFLDIYLWLLCYEQALPRCLSHDRVRLLTGRLRPGRRPRRSSSTDSLLERHTTDIGGQDDKVRTWLLCFHTGSPTPSNTRQCSKGSLWVCDL